MSSNARGAEGETEANPSYLPAAADPSPAATADTVPDFIEGPPDRRPSKNFVRDRQNDLLADLMSKNGEDQYE